MIRKIKDYIIVNTPFISNRKRAELLRYKLKSMGMKCEIFKSVDLGSEPYLIELGDNVRLTYGVRFITHDGGVHVLRNLGKIKKESIYGKIKIANNVFVGNQAMLLPGIEVGENVIIGARSVVTKSIPSNSIVAGCPAKIISNIDEYYDKYKSKFIDTSYKTYNEKQLYLLNLDLEKFINK